jgi:hypothetical protein
MPINVFIHFSCEIRLRAHHKSIFSKLNGNSSEINSSLGGHKLRIFSFNSARSSLAFYELSASFACSEAQVDANIIAAFLRSPEIWCFKTVEDLFRFIPL